MTSNPTIPTGNSGDVGVAVKVPLSDRELPVPDPMGWTIKQVLVFEDASGVTFKESLEGMASLRVMVAAVYADNLLRYPEYELADYEMLIWSDLAGLFETGGDATAGEGGGGRRPFTASVDLTDYGSTGRDEPGKHRFLRMLLVCESLRVDYFEARQHWTMREWGWAGEVYDARMEARKKADQKARQAVRRRIR